MFHHINNLFFILNFFYFIRFSRVLIIAFIYKIHLNANAVLFLFLREKGDIFFILISKWIIFCSWFLKNTFLMNFSSHHYVLQAKENFEIETRLIINVRKKFLATSWAIEANGNFLFLRWLQNFFPLKKRRKLQKNLF